MQTRQQKRHPDEKQFEFTRPLADHLRTLILKAEEDLAANRVQEWIFFQESTNPTYMGKAEAEEKLGLYQKYGKSLEQKVELFRLYAKAHDIIL